MSDLDDLILQSDDLPSLPEIYIRVSELLEDDYASVHDIGEAVQTDASLTTKILKVVNSAYFGLPNKVSSIAQSVSLLGRKQLKQILTGSVLVQLFSDALIENFSMSEFWSHSIKTAIISRHLALQSASIIDHDAFFTAGLLHDIGRLLIAKAIPELLVEINFLVEDEGMDIIQAEQQVLGYSHADAGQVMLRKWGLPSLLSQCAAKHHDEEHEGPFAIDTSIVYLANQLSRNELPSNVVETQEVLDSVNNWQQCECDVGQITAACRLADEQGLDVMASFGMNDMTID